MSKIGIFGGTFNPIHKGHIALATQIKEQCGLDQMMLIPSNQPPHKTAVYLASNQDRFSMCELATKGLKDFTVNPIELKRGGQSYTIHTIRALKKARPQDDFFLIVGSDMIFGFDLWKEYKEILQQVPVLVGAREEKELEAMKNKAYELMRDGGEVRVVEVDVNPMSSTKIRMMLSLSIDCKKLLPQEVYRYILHYGIYQNQNMETMLQELKPIVQAKLCKKRYFHTGCVAKQAALLASHYGEDPDIAYLCGYLHDIMKCEDKKHLLQYLSDSGIILSDIEKMIPAVWHSIAGALYCKRTLGIKDAKIINAVRYHTTARENMTMLEKIIYVADAIGEDREYPQVEEMRKLAFSDLDQAALYNLRFSIHNLMRQGKPIHPDSLHAYNALMGQVLEEAE